MSAVAERTATAPGAAGRLQLGCYVIEGLNAMAAAFYFNYLFFYLRDHFGFGDRENLLMTAVYGFVYMFASWWAGVLAPRHGNFPLLRRGLRGMLAAMILGGVVWLVWGYGGAAKWAHCAVLGLWAVSQCFTWPMMQGLLSQQQSPANLPRAAGIYNLVWAGTQALAVLTGGAFMEFFGGEFIFVMPVLLHGVQLLMLPRLQKLGTLAARETAVAPPSGGPPPALNPRPIARARMFRRLGWLANPFAYVAIYGLLPVIPSLMTQFHLSHAQAGLASSVWVWVRLAAFGLLWLWPGWHYRFDYLLGAFAALIGSFVVMLLGANLWVFIAAQVVFGLAVGLIYYSSLFYSLDASEAIGERGGIHEAAIGLGTFLGPLAGFLALQFFPQHPASGTWSIGALLVVGAGLMLAVRRQSQRAANSR